MVLVREVCVPVVGSEGLGITWVCEEGLVFLVTLVFVGPCVRGLVEGEE